MDPCTPLLFDLYHYLEQNVYFSLVPLSSRSFLVAGFNTHVIPRSFSCGMWARINESWDRLDRAASAVAILTATHTALHTATHTAVAHTFSRVKSHSYVYTYIYTNIYIYIYTYLLTYVGIHTCMYVKTASRNK